MRKLIKKHFIIIVLGIAASLMVGCGQPDALDAFGAPIYLKDIKGKWILLNYWADWCKPCSEEIPTFNYLTENYADQLVILGINFDQMPQEKLQQYIKHRQVHYAMLTNNLGSRFGISHVNTLPATIVISPKGEIVKELYGAQSVDELLALMQLKPKQE